MTRVTPIAGLLANLDPKTSLHGRAYLPRDRALQLLKEWTGQDFGYDVTAWEEWLRTHRASLPPQMWWP
jgi:hypothetical protein